MEQLPERPWHGDPKLALITTPYEVQAGSIDHALEMTVFNSMFGPPCTEAEVGTAAAGSTCGFYVPPATRVEWNDGPPNNCGENTQPNTGATREKTIPEGMRFLIRGNPMSLFVRAYRERLLSTDAPQWDELAIVMVWSVTAFFLGGLFFRHLKRGFADVL